ncbi:histidinol-phosphatase [Prolixibacteraceae bacterium JC049]|nr:histidinol-phosphatase [Prolixibacteraceae bacterium JC049]
MKKLISIILFVVLSLGTWAQRTEIKIPDIPNFVTLKCDFHMHSVFSDGSVWPTVRVEEAWRDGLDAIALTEHIEYRPHSQDITSDHNRSYEIALPVAKQKGILLVKAAEITRAMPPGHLNVLFTKNNNLLERENVLDALKEAKEQGAFFIWNHPGWKAQQPDTIKWYDMHTQLYDNGMMHGVEIFNEKEYYPEVFQWALDKQLTIFANSDVHSPIDMTYINGEKRPITLVFAKNKSLKSLKQAMFKHQTATYFNGKIMGDSKWLKPIFKRSIKVMNHPVGVRNNISTEVHIHNSSELDYHLESTKPGIGIDYPNKLVLKAGKTTSFTISGNSVGIGNVPNLTLFYTVKNLWIKPDENLSVEIKVRNL